jgi:hypothetical protein
MLVLGCAGDGTALDGPRAAELGAAPSASALVAPAAVAPAVPATVAVERAALPVRTAEARCREQRAQRFLLRDGQIARIGAPAAERRAIEAARERSIEYRTRQYGRVPGVGSSLEQRRPPSFYARRARFMGLPVVLHERVLPALACVEQALLRECAEHAYRPKRLGGLRRQNTFKDYEVSNHLFGIALDVDPDLNPCCHCVGNWSKHGACAKQVSSIFERMAMPKCWVDVFERHGFHWLGHDELQDTMHFEFLGDPERILET